MAAITRHLLLHRTQANLCLMKPISVVCTVFLLISSVTLAQKNRPIVQDAIKIIGYIQKDYSVITDEEQRIETMMQDRSAVIVLLKSYLTVPSSFASATDDGLKMEESKLVSLQEQLTDLNQRKRAANPQKIEAIDRLISAKQLEIIEQLRNLNNTKYDKIDSFNLSELKKQLSNNDYLREVIDALIKKYDSLKSSSGQTLDPYALSGGDASIAKGLPLIGGVDLTFTQAIDGLARFLAKRLKQELAWIWPLYFHLLLPL